MRKYTQAQYIRDLKAAVVEYEQGRLTHEAFESKVRWLTSDRAAARLRERLRARRIARGELLAECAIDGHDMSKTHTCVRCGKDLCEICGSDEHRTSEGHDLNNPRYWGV